MTNNFKFGAVALAMLGMLAGCGNHKTEEAAKAAENTQDNEAVVETETVEVFQMTDGEHTLNGMLGEVPVSITIARTGTTVNNAGLEPEVAGTVTYTDSGTTYNLKGSQSSAVYELFEVNDNGQQSGVFRLVSTPAGMEGSYTNLANGQETQVNFTPAPAQ